MADFLGLGGGIEKVEEYLGKRVTGVFIVIVVLAVAAVSMKAIWDNLVQPITKFVRTPLWGQELLSYIWIGGTIMLGVAGGLHMATAVSRWRQRRYLEDLIDRAKNLSGESERHFESVKETYGRAEEALAKSREFIEENEELRQQSAHVMEIISQNARVFLDQNKDISDEDRAAAEARIRDFEEEIASYRSKSGDMAEQIRPSLEGDDTGRSS